MNLLKYGGFIIQNTDNVYVSDLAHYFFLKGNIYGPRNSVGHAATFFEGRCHSSYLEHWPTIFFERQYIRP